MRVFVTCATGFIGQAVVQELLSAGHRVLGLARSDKGAESLAALGVEAHRGSLGDLDSLKRGASASDAREKGVSAYIGDGLNRWPATHRLDAARVFQLALDKASAGSTFHAVAEEGVSIKDIAEIIGKQLNVPVVSKAKEEAQQHFGWLAFALMGDNPTSSAKTREQLGWSPVHASLISDLKEGTYFKN
ncbi:hypothetical protein OEA41_004957 [Lepraria neglecta]|uniref:NmrA-like domain-containing protein n=1 Tax=Lepraria neglecta TaxID=209136 RepID=A0AAD9YYJ7_9LECA|nr:hypothetical protein OEA41_004957 [Lepraria neglecta]